ncbi:MAG: HAD family hydrolase [Conexivisphaera sp.]
MLREAHSGYVDFGTWSGIAAYRADALEELRSADSIILDCDGTLVDVRRSYPVAAVESARFLAVVSGHPTPPAPALSQLVPTLKESGLFNNDWDTALALYLAWVKHVEDGRQLAEAALELASISDPAELYEMGREFSGNLLDGCPGPPPRCYLSSVFDSIYYGLRLYTELYSSPPPIPIDHGLLEDESSMVGAVDLRALAARFNGSIGVITGRPRRAVRGPLLELLGPMMAGGRVFFTEELGVQKPDPRPLLEAVSKMGSSSVIYVGDSAEDLLMVERSVTMGLRASFVGVYGAALDPGRAFRWFASRGASAIIPSPGTLHLLLDRRWISRARPPPRLASSGTAHPARRPNPSSGAPAPGHPLSCPRSPGTSSRTRPVSART